MDTATTPLIDFLARFDDKGSAEAVAAAADQLSLAVEDTTDRIESANIDWVQAGAFVDQAVVMLQGSGDPKVRSGRRHSLRGAKGVAGARSRSRHRQRTQTSERQRGATPR